MKALAVFWQLKGMGNFDFVCQVEGTQHPDGSVHVIMERDSFVQLAQIMLETVEDTMEDHDGAKESSKLHSESS
jgi:hypothetical protein